MDCNFVVGQKVVCVNADPNYSVGFYTGDGDFYIGDGDMDNLTEGQIYTVSKIYIHITLNLPCIEVAEIIRKPVIGASKEESDKLKAKYGDGFLASRFRPLKETGMEKLKSLLNPDNHDMNLYDEKHPLELEEEFETSV